MRTRGAYFNSAFDKVRTLRHPAQKTRRGWPIMGSVRCSRTSCEARSYRSRDPCPLRCRHLTLELQAYHFEPELPSESPAAPCHSLPPSERTPHVGVHGTRRIPQFGARWRSACCAVGIAGRRFRLLCAVTIAYSSSVAGRGHTVILGPFWSASMTAQIDHHNSIMRGDLVPLSGKTSSIWRPQPLRNATKL